MFKPSMIFLLFTHYWWETCCVFGYVCEGFFYLRHLAWDYINFRIFSPTLVLPVAVVVGVFLIRCLAFFIIICLQLLTCIRFFTDWLTTEIYRVDKSHRRLRVTNILSVLFSKRLSIKWDIFFLTRIYYISFSLTRSKSSKFSFPAFK